MVILADGRGPVERTTLSAPRHPVCGTRPDLDARTAPMIGVASSWLSEEGSVSDSANPTELLRWHRQRFYLSQQQPLGTILNQ